jgi:hypothetical protein
MKNKLICIQVFILFSLVGCRNISNNKITKIDITGNWQDVNGFPAYIQTREPALKKGELKSFSQELLLPKGNYTLQFEYDQQYDQIHNGSFENNITEFNGFKINGVITRLAFSADSAGKNIYPVYHAKSELIIKETEKTIKLELAIHNTRVMRTWLTGSTMPMANQNFFAVDPGPTKEYLLIRGIPFLARKTDIRETIPWFKNDELRESANEDRGSLNTWNNGMNFNLQGTKVDKLHFLGMIHNVDIANGSWYSPKGDNGYSHFIGDKAGEIIISFMNKEKTIVPLIFGFNLWYGRPWDMFWCYFPTTPDSWPPGYNYDSTLFSGNQSYRDLIQNTISLVDGMRVMGSGSNNTRFIFSLDLQNKPVQSIEIKGVDDMYGHPLISAITVETAEPSSVLSPLPVLGKNIFQTKPVTVQYILNEGYKPSLEKLKRVIYTFKDEMPKLKDPEIPENYFGPNYNFKGTQEAVYAATYLYRNGPECGAKIADNGTGCASSIARKQTVHYTLGIGIWREEPSFSLFGNLQNWFRLYQTKSPGNLPGAGQAWSRGIGELIREAMAFGYGKFINTYTDWLDSCLFAEANPPHWTRIVGSGNKYVGHETRKVGNTIETGNRENDGHGICMWGRYLTYHWLGHPPAWNEKHWKATKAAVDWILWQLDTDTIFPGKRKDVLYTESECGNYEFYASYNILHGVNLSIIMAKELGKAQEVESWTKLYNRLQQGILDNIVDSSEFGPVWHTDPKNNWTDDAQKMAHIQLAPDGITYTPLQDYAVADLRTRKYLKIDINSYRLLMKDKNYNCLRMYGYGQGMMTQAALLLDEMNDAENFINQLVDHCYLPRMEGWTAPEGIILHRSGEYWVPVNGYMGQDSHLADSQKALRLMLGIDDNNSDNLRIIPRYPSSWDQMSISDFPVLTGNKRQKIKYSYIRNEKGQVFTYGFQNPVKNVSLRLGPIPEGKDVFKATLNGEKVAIENLNSGDSRWVWIKNLSGQHGKVEIQYQ